MEGETAELYIYDKELIAYYDFAQKKYIAVKDWMKGSVDRWNKEEAAGTYQDGIRVCENNVPLASEVVSRKVKLHLQTFNLQFKMLKDDHYCINYLFEHLRIK
eukprot:g27506.t1